MYGQKDWEDAALIEKGERLKKRGEVDTLIGGLAVSFAREQAAYDAGFAYGVEAQANGLGDNG